MTEKFIRLISDEGQGAAVAILRASSRPSKAATVLAQDFRVLSYTVSGEVPAAAAELVASLGSMVSEVAVIADTASASTAIALAVASGDLVKSVALLSPAVTDFGDLSDLTTPVLAIFSAADPSRAPDVPRNFCRTIPNCRLVYVYGTGEAPDDERPHAVAAALFDFATRGEKFLVNARSSRLYP